MIESEEHPTESNPNINDISELPIKRFHGTIEISMFVTMLTISLTGTAVSNLLLYRTCVHSLNYPEPECKIFLSLEKNNETEHLEKEVQKYTTFVSTVKSVVESVAPAVLSLYLGVWSDTYGRKPLVVWPLFGISISGILLVVYSMLPNLGPWWYILVVMPYSLSGGMVILFTGAFCYLSDVTTIESRSLRMTILEASVSAGSVVGGIISAHVLKLVGIVYLLLIGAAFNVFIYAFTNICLKESLPGSIQGGLDTVLNFEHVKEMIRQCFKRRPNNGRAQILLLTFANSLTIFILYGLMGLEYLYVRRKLLWALEDYTVFSAVNTTISFVGGLVGVAFVQNFLKISDLSFTHVAFVSCIAEYLAKTLAVSSWHMYLGAGISAFKGLSSPLLRSFLTKILPLEDIAKVFALMSVIEGVAPLVALPLYNSLYEFTISIFPAAIYLLSCGIVGICILFVGIVQYYRRGTVELLINESDTTQE